MHILYLEGYQRGTSRFQVLGFCLLLFSSQTMGEVKESTKMQSFCTFPYFRVGLDFQYHSCYCICVHIIGRVRQPLRRKRQNWEGGNRADHKNHDYPLIRGPYIRDFVPCIFTDIRCFLRSAILDFSKMY